MKKRLMFWDNYKGLLIFLVVFTHFLYTYSLAHYGSVQNYVVNFIYTFHMAAFIFCSGYLSQSKNSQSGKAIFKLLLYYVVFNTLMMLFLWYYKGTDISFLTPYNSYWYILALIFWRIFAKYLDKVKFIVPISIVVALFLGFYSEFANILALRRTIAFFPFFIIGYKISSEKFTSFIENRDKRLFILGIVGLVVFSFIVGFYIVNFNFTERMLLLGSYTAPIDMIYRIILFVIAFIFILLFTIVIPNKKIFLLTTIGRNSLPIYVLHRFFTIIFAKVFRVADFNYLYFIYALIASVLVVVIFGNDKFTKVFNKFFNSIADKLLGTDKKAIISRVVAALFILSLLSYRPIVKIYRSFESHINLKEETVNVVSSDLKKEIKNSITISYVGDLILLKDQVTSAYNKKTDSYNFDDVFKYATPYLKSADLAVGVFEGPMAGSKKPYSTSNFGDGIKMYLNFPDSFATSVKKSGIDLVTTANNHLLDNGVDGAYRTLDVLDKNNIKHIGSYKNTKDKEKNRVQVIEVDGVKIGILSYLKSVNYYSASYLEEKYPYITSFLPNDGDKNYDELYNEIENDFKTAKKKADVVMVFVHMGTQFKHTTDDFQKKWNKNFVRLGADVVLGDHAHAVQPIEYINDSVIVNCPGNFANSYVNYDGDATALVQIYISKKKNKVIGSSLVPMYTQEMKKGYFRALPIYDILNNKNLKKEVSSYEMKRVAEVQKVVTKSAIGKEIDLDNAKEKYYYINNNYYSNNTEFNKKISKYKKKKIYKLIGKSKRITFIGDSITEGTKNSFHGWYEPLMSSFNNKRVINISKGGYTSRQIFNEYGKQIENADSNLYIIALGTNDVRYRNSKTCAMTSDKYVETIDKIVKLIHKSNKDAKIVLIAPWMSLSNDHLSRLPEKEKNEMLDEYGDALEKYSKENKYLFINPNSYLRDFFKKNDSDLYLVDFIHPNSSLGIKLYSEAILNSSK